MDFDDIIKPAKGCTVCARNPALPAQTGEDFRQRIAEGIGARAALKLIGVAPVAAWSWWAVTAPLWGKAALLALYAIIRK